MWSWVSALSSGLGASGVLGGALYWLRNQYLLQRAVKAKPVPPGQINFRSCITRPNAAVPGQPIKKAVTIGINYSRTNNQLFGCQNDSNNMKRVLAEKYKFNEILQLTDDTAIQPTLNNIVFAIRWLVSGAQDGDELYFHYSGHGSQHRATKESMPYEEDGMDETIVPIDFQTAGYLVDNVIYDELVKTLYGKSVKLNVIVDACHSGTMLDLAFSGRITSDNRIVTVNYVPKEQVSIYTMKPNILFLSGCLDHQTSADAGDSVSGSYGALTNAFLKVLGNYSYKPTVDQLFTGVHRELQQGKFSQHPELGSNRPLNVSQPW